MSFVEIFATWFGCGKSPKAPGTVGTFGAIPLVWAFSLAGPINYLALTMIFTLVAIWVAHLQELQSGRHDDKSVVIDEVAGFLVTMAWVPFNWTYVILGFALFRLFDVWKPFPISYVDQKVGGGVGCVGDDLIAGILGNIILQVILQQRWIG